MDKRYISKELSKCIESIYGIFNSEVFIFLDCVLTDDLDEPEYSANTAYNRLEYMRIFENEYYQKNIASVSDFLFQNGYTKEDIELLRMKCIDENRRYNQFDNKV